MIAILVTSIFVPGISFSSEHFHAYAETTPYNLESNSTSPTLNNSTDITNSSITNSTNGLELGYSNSTDITNSSITNSTNGLELGYSNSTD
ncbi:MAG: hypothetical protein HY223_00050 [Thaumarchaeota archaeon]|nr:hypothetical protein [Nitrososphaerota archaeon]